MPRNIIIDPPVARLGKASKPKGSNMHSMIRLALGTTMIVAAASSALAHVTLERREAPAGTYYKAVLGVPHGCEGSETVAIHVDIPEGVIAVKPMPKSGWQLSSEKGAYARSYQNHGRAVAEGIKRVSWRGGVLADEHYDEFVFVAYLAEELEPGKPLYFRVLQECTRGSNDWRQTPTEGSHDHLEHPAPSLLVGKSSPPHH